MRLWLLKLLRKCCISIGKWSARTSTRLKANNRRKMQERMLELVSKEKLSKSERTELEKLMQTFKEDNIIIL